MDSYRPVAGPYVTCWQWYWLDDRGVWSVPIVRVLDTIEEIYEQSAEGEPEAVPLKLLGERLQLRGGLLVRLGRMENAAYAE